MVKKESLKKVEPKYLVLLNPEYFDPTGNEEIIGDLFLGESPASKADLPNILNDLTGKQRELGKDDFIILEINKVYHYAKGVLGLRKDEPIWRLKK